VSDYEISKVGDFFKYIYDDVMLIKLKVPFSNFNFIIFEIFNENLNDFIKADILKEIIAKFIVADENL
jgi:hypothetical protein